MNSIEQKKAAKEFYERWKDRGKEKSDSQKFWIDLLEHVYGVKDYVNFIEFEYNVLMDKTNGWMDGYIATTKVLIEQKSKDFNLKSGIRQSDGTFKTPFQQAKSYAQELGHDKYPRWVVTCNFKSFLIYDMNNINNEPEEVLLKDLSQDFYRLEFLVDTKNDHIRKEEDLSFKAGDLVGKLYNAFSHEYKDINNPQSQKDLNELCVRLVFCLYAEDADLFGKKGAFHDYLSKYDDLTLMRENLIKLFKVLDTPEKDRDPYLEDDLNQFPYINGGLFSNENIEIPYFTEEIRKILLAKAADEFDWSEISPTIFGAVFESTLNPDTRRDGGMHYTTIENIHKVIDPLFLNKLRSMLDEAESYKNEKTRNNKLIEFQNYISSLIFLDPACGSGNFLTETYLSLRRLENEALEIYSHGMPIIDMSGIVKVSIQQFYGIEINDFAVKVAKTALWIAESQMWKETSKLVIGNTNILDFLPLESYDNIIEGNALRVDWENIISKDKCSYIMGNPPFVGSSRTDEQNEQKSDMKLLFSNVKGAGKLDYVAGWYIKAAKYIIGTKIKCAFVSTNSITQGEQVSLLWKELIENYNIEINFGYKSFKWTSESNQSATVVCVIIGFSNKETVNDEPKYLFENCKRKKVTYINGYLSEQNDFYIKSRTNSLTKTIPEIIQGNKPWDGGNLILSEEEYEKLIIKYPKSNHLIKRYVGGNELINNKKRYCLWLKDMEPSDYRNIPEIMERLKKVSEERLKTKTKAVQEQATIPMLFSQIRQPNTSYLAIPEVSTDSRRYIPMAYLSKDDISSNKIFMIPDCPLYIFGILISNVHMAWMRSVAGRLGTGYSYSPSVYNNFPWPSLNDEQKQKIEKSAKMILDIRLKYKNSTLADLYDELTMPSDLRTAHQINDKIVWETYGKIWDIKSETDCVSKLMEMYKKMTNNR